MTFVESSRTPQELRSYFEGHRAGYSLGQMDQKRDDDKVIAAMFGRFDPQKQTGAAPVPYDDPPSDDQ